VYSTCCLLAANNESIVTKKFNKNIARSRHWPALSFLPVYGPVIDHAGAALAAPVAAAQGKGRSRTTMPA